MYGRIRKNYVIYIIIRCYTHESKKYGMTRATSFGQGQNAHHPQRSNLWNNKEDQLGNRSSLILNGPNSRFYSPLYEQRYANAGAIKTLRPLQLQGSLHIGSPIGNSYTHAELDTGR